MSVLVDKNTRLVVQGITGSVGAFHTRQCMDYGTSVVAGVTPGRAANCLMRRCPCSIRCGKRDGKLVAMLQWFLCLLPRLRILSLKQSMRAWSWWFALQKEFR